MDNTLKMYQKQLRTTEHTETFQNLKRLIAIHNHEECHHERIVSEGPFGYMCYECGESMG